MSSSVGLLISARSDVTAGPIRLKFGINIGYTAKREPFLQNLGAFEKSFGYSYVGLFQSVLGSHPKSRFFEIGMFLYINEVVCSECGRAVRVSYFAEGWLGAVRFEPTLGRNEMCHTGTVVMNF